MGTFLAGLGTGFILAVGVIFIMGALRSASDYDDEVAELYRQQSQTDDGGPSADDQTAHRSLSEKMEAASQLIANYSKASMALALVIVQPGPMWKYAQVMLESSPDLSMEDFEDMQTKVKLETADGPTPPADAGTPPQEGTENREPK